MKPVRLLERPVHHSEEKDVAHGDPQLVAARRSRP